MYSLHLTCPSSACDFVGADLWEAGACGIREIDDGDRTRLIAAFETNGARAALLEQFSAFAPDWTVEQDIDWVRHTRDAWPGRTVGSTLFLAAPWCEEATPAGRKRLIHNPGLACGTGEHQCTQMALTALEDVVGPGMRVADIGTGSGMLVIASLLLGARTAVGVDTDEAALACARENCRLNGVNALLAAGSAAALASNSADVTIANISGTVLLAIWEDIERITRPRGNIIATGFTEGELHAFTARVRDPRVLALNEWRCVYGRAIS